MKEILTFPFMQHALLAGAIASFFLSLFGVFVTLKRLSFFGDGIAHASLSGIALGVLIGVNPLWLALIVALFFATGIYFLEKKTPIPVDAIIGLIFSGGMAIGILLMSFKRGYQPELIGYLFGNILTISKQDLLITIFLGSLIILFLLLFQRSLALTILDEEEASLCGIKVNLLEFLFYIALAITIVLGLKLLGIVLVSALLIIPPITAKFFSNSFKRVLLNSVIIGEITVISGLILSYYLDTPSGAVIVLVGIFLFGVGGIFHLLRGKIKVR